MRVAYAEAMCDPTHYVPLAQAAEEVGFDAFVIPDSIAYPEHSYSKYPYTPDGNREFLDGAPFIDPFVLTATLAAATKTLRFRVPYQKDTTPLETKLQSIRMYADTVLSKVR